ncbi:MAG: hypothetical protein H6713_32580 [Myxococcales bacterium]|nr:hypothetical protein [Myxococcales bacterium]
MSLRSRWLLAALPLLAAPGCYHKPGTLGLPCTADSECDAGEFCVDGQCASQPGGSTDGTTGPATTAGASSGATTIGGDSDATTEGLTGGASEATATTTSETSETTEGTATTGMDCPEGQIIVDGECALPPCEDRVCGDVGGVWAIFLDAPYDGANRPPQSITDIVVSSDGVVYIVGAVNGPMDYGDGDDYGAPGERYVYLAAYDASQGTNLWVKQFRVDGPNTHIFGVAYDESSDKIAIAGQLDGEIDLDPDNPNLPMNSMGIDGFVAQYDTNGTYEWHALLDGFGLQTARAVAYGVTDQAVYVAGEYDTKLALFDMLPPANPEFENVYIAKLKKNDGSSTWTEGFGNAQNAMHARAITVGANNSVTWGGDYTETFVYDGNASVPDAGGAEAPIIMGMSSSGAYVWHDAPGGGGVLSQTYGGVAANPTTGTLFTSGYFQGAIAFDGRVYNSGESHDIFLARYTGGVLSWGRVFGGDGSQYSPYAATNSDGSAVLLGGSCGGSIDFDGGALTAVGYDDGCFARFNSDGEHVWSLLLGGDNTPPMNGTAFEGGGAVAIGPDGRSYLTGMFTGSLSLGDVSATTTDGDRVHYLIALDDAG